MIPRLYLSTTAEFDSNGEGLLRDTLECYVEEERNGLFDLSMKIPVDSFLFDKIEKGNIIKAHASDRLKNQLFRINIITKPIDGIVLVYAKHIFFDLDKDFIESLSINNQSCEYVLNQIFKNSRKSKHFIGTSDIVNSQSYAIEKYSPLECIAGKEGSIIDTFGTGAEILRDNFTVSVNNTIGKTNNVLIAYGKNLDGFELKEDVENIICEIYPYVKYKDSDNNELEFTLQEKYVQSPRIGNYDFPTKTISKDFSDKFEDNEVPTESKLREVTLNYFTESKCDIPKCSYSIKFIPLSKTENYKEYKFLEDVGMCDKVHIWNSKYNIKDEAKVIKTKYNVLTERYESVELGEPKTTLGNLIGSGESTVGPQGPQGIPGQDGADGDIGDFPDSLPSVPVITLKSGLGVIAIDWTFENKVYYTYEVYASQKKDFIPNAFDLIFKGQASSFSHYSEPNQTWYYKVRAINSHGNATEFSSQKSATTGVIDADTEWIGKAAIGNAQIGTLSLDRGWVDQLKGQWIDARTLTVTDGNGKRTFEVDSFGEVTGDVTSWKIRSESVALDKDVDNVAGMIGDVAGEVIRVEQNLGAQIGGVSTTVSSIQGDYVGQSQFSQTFNSFEFGLQNNSKNNILKNGRFKAGISYWNNKNNNDLLETYGDFISLEITEQNRYGSYDSDTVECEANTLYTLYAHLANETIEYTDYAIVKTICKVVYLDSSNNVIGTEDLVVRDWQVGWNDNDISNATFTTPSNCSKLKIEYAGSYTNAPYRVKFKIYSKGFCITKGENKGYFPSADEIYSESVLMDTNGITIKHKNGAYSIFNSDGSNFYSSDGMDMTSLRNGGVIGYHAPTNEMIGHIFPTNKSNGDVTMNGWSISNSIVGDYIAMAKANNNEESGFTLQDIIICYTNDVEHLGGRPKGTYFDLLDVNFNTRVFFNNHVYLQNKALLFNSRDYDYHNEIVANVNNNNDFEIHGCDALTFGIRHGYEKKHAIAILKDLNTSSKCKGYLNCDFEMNQYAFFNGHFFGTVHNQYASTDDIAIELLETDYAKISDDGESIVIDNASFAKELYIKNKDLEEENTQLKIEQEKQNEEIVTNMVANTEIFEMVLGMIPISINKKSNNGGDIAMVEVYATLIIKGVKTIDQVPLIIRGQVEQRLKELEVQI